MLYLQTLSNEELVRVGNRNGLGSALVIQVINLKMNIKKLTDAHVRKYPD